MLKEKLAKEKEESLLTFFRSAIVETSITARMQKEYFSILGAGIKIMDTEQLKKTRKIFMDDQVVQVYRKFLQDRSQPRPTEVEMLSNDEQMMICFGFSEQIEITACYGYPLALELFFIIAQRKGLTQVLVLTPLQIAFISKFKSLAVAEAANISLALFEVYFSANLMPELIEEIEK